MGIGGLGPQDGVKIIEHDMTILITNLAIMGYGSCAFYKPLDLFFSCISNNISSAWSG